MSIARPTRVKRRGGVTVVFLLLACCILASIAVLSVRPVYVGAFILLLAAVTYMSLNLPRRRVWALLAFITFPVTIQMGGNDAFSSGTLLIGIMLLILWATRGTRAFQEDRTLLLLLCALVLAGALGLVTGLQREYWGIGARHWLDLVSSVGGMTLIVCWARGSERSRRAYVEAVITSLLSVAALHVVLSLILRQWPEIESHLSIFLARGQESLGRLTAEGSYARATTLFTRGEEFGELLLVLFPFGLYKLFTSRVVFYLPLTLLLVVGAVYSGTRSSLLLILLQALVFSTLLVFRRARGKNLMVAVATLLLLAASATFITSILDTTISRLTMSAELVQQGNSLTAILNRDLVWSPAYAITKSTLSWFGHGPVQAYATGLGNYNFHSLYMTWIYQFGIVGTLIWVAFFAHLGRRLWSAAHMVRLRGGREALLSGACFLSLLCFLVNEVKFEFNRGDSYQQVVWLIFGLIYVAADSVKRSAAAEQNRLTRQ